MSDASDQVMTHLQERAESFWRRVAVGAPDECWEWTVAKTNRGYGRVTFSIGSFPTHRVAYMLAKGSIPEGHEIDHLCRNKSCSNPAHLEAVTRDENRARHLATTPRSGSIEVRHGATGTRWRVRWREEGRNCAATFMTEAEARDYLAERKAS